MIIRTRTLTWWREIANLTPTAYPRLRLAHLDRCDWRIIATDGTGTTRPVGGYYTTKAQAAAALQHDPALADWRTMEDARS